MKIIEEVGNIYGRLTVISRAENKDNRAQWLCNCECGNQIVVSGKLLRNGHVKSCGCLKKDTTIQRNISKAGDLKGKKFGKLVVLSNEGMIKKSNGKNVQIWKCKCDCGRTCYVQTRYLKSGDTSSCGCSHSKGEAEIANFLNVNLINYKKEFVLSDFRYKNNSIPRFDFALFDTNGNLLCLIEYQGDIHFNYSGTGWNTRENFEIRKKHDEEKLIYCKDNDIVLYTITYLDNIKERMEEIISEQYENNN